MCVTSRITSNKPYKTVCVFVRRATGSLSWSFFSSFLMFKYHLLFVIVLMSLKLWPKPVTIHPSVDHDLAHFVCKTRETCKKPLSPTLLLLLLLSPVWHFVLCGSAATRSISLTSCHQRQIVFCLHRPPALRSPSYGIWFDPSPVTPLGQVGFL